MNTNIDDSVKVTVEAFVRNSFMFSAFDVTKTVRSILGKHIFVSHNDVRDIVSGIYAQGDHGCMGDDYTRGLAKIGTNAEAWVYSPYCSDISNYDADWIDSNPNQDGMKADKDSNSTNSMPPLALGVAVGDTTLQMHNKDSVGNPSSPIQKAITAIKNFKSPFAKAIDSNTLPTSVNTKTNDCKEKLHDLTKEGRLNIPKSVLQEAGLDRASDMVLLIHDNNRIVISDPLRAINNQDFDYVKYSDKTGRIRLSLLDISPIATIGAYNHRYKISCSPYKEVIVEATF